MLLSLTTAVTTVLGSLVVGGVMPAGGLLAVTAVIGTMIVVLAQRVVVGSSRNGEHPRTSSGPQSSPGGSLRVGPASPGLVPSQRLAASQA